MTEEHQDHSRAVGLLEREDFVDDVALERDLSHELSRREQRFRAGAGALDGRALPLPPTRAVR
jgi:hypothetical protein